VYVSVKNTLEAVCAMQGLKLLGMPEDAQSKAALNIWQVASEMRNEMAYLELVDAQPKMDNTSVDVLLDVFGKGLINFQINL